MWPRCSFALPLGDRADPDRKQIIPPVFDAPSLSSAASEGSAGSATYEFEPEAEDILHELLPRNIAVQIFRALLENAASFSGAQMSRDGQCDAQRRRHDPPADAHYNRTRQAQITKELIEIISGAEAL